MSDTKRAIEILERHKKDNEKLLSEPYYLMKGTAEEYRDSYQLAITALKRVEAVRAYAVNLSSVLGSERQCKSDILEILEGKQA